MQNGWPQRMTSIGTYTLVIHSRFWGILRIVINVTMVGGTQTLLEVVCQEKEANVYSL